jgi:CBS domain-containing protein
MQTPVITAAPTDSLRDVACQMIENRIGGLPVIGAEGEVLGAVSRNELFPCERNIPFSLVTAPKLFDRFIDLNNLPEAYRGAGELPVQNVMAQKFVCVTAETPLAEVAAVMMQQKLDRVGVLAHGRLVGIIARSDLLQLIPGVRRP